MALQKQIISYLVQKRVPASQLHALIVSDFHARLMAQSPWGAVVSASVVGSAVLYIRTVKCTADGIDGVRVVSILANQRESPEFDLSWPDSNFLIAQISDFEDSLLQRLGNREALRENPRELRTELKFLQMCTAALWQGDSGRQRGGIKYCRATKEQAQAIWHEMESGLALIRNQAGQLNMHELSYLLRRIVGGVQDFANQQICGN